MRSCDAVIWSYREIINRVRASVSSRDSLTSSASLIEGTNNWEKREMRKD